MPIEILYGYRKCCRCERKAEYANKRGWWIFSTYRLLCLDHAFEEQE